MHCDKIISFFFFLTCTPNLQKKIKNNFPITRRFPKNKTKKEKKNNKESWKKKKRIAYKNGRPFSSHPIARLPSIPCGSQENQWTFLNVH